MTFALLHDPAGEHRRRLSRSVADLLGDVLDGSQPARRALVVVLHASESHETRRDDSFEVLECEGDVVGSRRTRIDGRIGSDAEVDQRPDEGHIVDASIDQELDLLRSQVEYPAGHRAPS